MSYNYMNVGYLLLTSDQERRKSKSEPRYNSESKALQLSCPQAQECRLLLHFNSITNRRQFQKLPSLGNDCMVAIKRYNIQSKVYYTCLAWFR